MQSSSLSRTCPIIVFEALTLSVSHRLSYCLLMAPQRIFWPKLCPRFLVLGTQSCFSLLLSWLIPSFWLTILFCPPSISPSPDSRAFIVAMSIPQFSLAWPGSSLAWSSAATSQKFLMLGLACSHDRFALYIGTLLSSPVSESWVVLGM